MQGSGQRFWELWGLYNLRGPSLDGLYPAAILNQAGKLAGLFLIVCFGSSMDVAAIQQDTPRKLDFDHELSTIGVCGVGVGGCAWMRWPGWGTCQRDACRLDPCRTAMHHQWVGRPWAGDGLVAAAI